MKVASIGLGDIAEKAYLPVLGTRADVELVLCTRSRDRLARFAATYRAAHAVSSVDDAIAVGLDAAFVHASTDAHVAIVRALLDAGVATYVDKPLAYSLDESASLVEAAERVGRPLFVGFNRRFAPLYREAQRTQSAADARAIVMTKHRVALPQLARAAVFDDFVHVVDTLRYFAGPGAELRDVDGAVRDGLLHHVTVRIASAGVTALGIMHRDTGLADEALHVAASGTSWTIRDLDAASVGDRGVETARRAGHWTSALHRRGFPQIIDHFLSVARGEAESEIPPRDALETHAMCERIVTSLTA